MATSKKKDGKKRVSAPKKMTPKKASLPKSKKSNLQLTDVQAKRIATTAMKKAKSSESWSSTKSNSGRASNSLKRVNAAKNSLEGTNRSISSKFDHKSGSYKTKITKRK